MTELATPGFDTHFAYVPEGEGHALALRYIVTNPFPVPLLVFDRWWDGDREAVDRVRVDVFFEDHGARLVRAWVEPPAGARGGEGEIPLGREIAPGTASEETVRVPLPLQEDGAWLFARRSAMAADDPGEVLIRTLVFELGWCALLDRAALPAGRRDPLEDGGERLVSLPVTMMAGAQRVLRSPTIAVELVGRRFREGALP